MAHRTGDRPGGWLGLGEASRLLGVSPATLRRWSDTGRLKAFTTPGGHRRFSRAALQRLLPSPRPDRPALSSVGVTPARLAARYRRELPRMSTALPWLSGLPDTERAASREHGRVLADVLIRHLDATSGDERRHLLEAAQLEAGHYGRFAATAGLSLSQTVEGFLRFRAPFLRSVSDAARRRGFDATETTLLLEATESAMDRLLIATMAGWRAVPHELVTDGSET